MVIYMTKIALAQFNIAEAKAHFSELVDKALGISGPLQGNFNAIADEYELRLNWPVES